jgi:hypothetical protein
MRGPFHLDKDKYAKQRDRTAKTDNGNSIVPSHITATIKAKQKSESCNDETESPEEVDASQLFSPM